MVLIFLKKGENMSIKNECFITVQGWMVNDLQLKGNELLVYAIIYGFSQDENCKFTGSLQYLADWTNSTKQGVIKCLKSLLEKGLIVKQSLMVNKVAYSTKFNTSVKQSLMVGVKQSLPNNINNNNINNNKNNKKEINKEKVELINTLNSYKDNFSEDCFNAIRDWLKYKKEKKQSYKLTGLKTLLNKLKGWKENNGDDYVIDAIQNSICNNYSGIFPKKDKQVDTPKKYGDGSVYDYIE